MKDLDIFALKQKISKIQYHAGFWLNGDDCDSGLNEIWHICDDVLTRNKDVVKACEEIEEWIPEIRCSCYNYGDAAITIEEIFDQEIKPLLNKKD